MKRIIHYLTILAIGLLMEACQPEGPAIEDHFLNYPIPEFQTVTHDYLVGIEYLYNVTSYGSSDKVIQIFATPPLVGRYASVFDMNAANTERILDVHLRWINQAKIDYVLLSCGPKYMTALPPGTAFSIDSTHVRDVIASPEIGDVKFALKYDFGTTLLGVVAPSFSDSSMIVENKITGSINAADAMIKDFVECLSVFYDNDRMLMVDGKPVIYIQNAYRLYSRNSIAFYKRLRQEVKQATGFDLFIVGQQERWSPPARWEFTLKNTVDAIYHSRYAEIDVNDFNRVYEFHPLTDQNWKYSKNWFNEWGTEYVPNISPGWNANLGSENPISPYYLPYNANSPTFFNKFCTIAKWNADKHNMILISSWNYWQYDSQIEPSEGYGTTYLDLVSKQFKVGQ